MSKKRVNGEGTIRKRKNGTWECRITISVDSTTGKQRQKSLYGKTQREVKAKLEELLAEQESQEKTSFTEESDSDDLTLNEWLDIWLADYLSDIKSDSLVSYKSLKQSYSERTRKMQT